MWKLICLLISGGLCINVELIDNAVMVNHLTTASIAAGSTHAERNNYNSSHRSLINEIITTDYGQVRGYADDGIMQFFDIPYGEFDAERPFQEPTEPAEWADVREIDAHNSRCPQIDEDNTYTGDHNCLTLSIFTPNTDESLRDASNGNGERAFDVLFHIHDSSFSSGSGDPLTYNPKNLVSEGIIVVLPNYRLGPLGFLCMLNESAPGNAALKDLTLALNWTMRNIEAFGGNSSNIVISGAGAGGALVEYLLLSNMSRIYISKAITESGFSLSPWAIDRTPLDTASLFLQNITADKNIEVIQSHNALDQTDLELLIRSGVNINFRPCVEQDSGLITETPWSMLQNVNAQFSYMCGTANHAATRKAIHHTQTGDFLNQLNNDLSLLLPSDLTFENADDKIQIGRQVKTLYFGERNITLDDVDKLAQCFTDSLYLNSGIRGSRLFVKGGATVYFYEFALNNTDDEIPFSGSTRGDSLELVFSIRSELEDEAKSIMRSMMTSLWISFIKTGQPSGENVEWNGLTDVAADEEEWLSIGDKIQMEKGVHLDRLRVWQNIYEKHFIERSPGSIFRPSICILLSTLSVLARIGAVASY